MSQEQPPERGQAQEVESLVLQRIAMLLRSNESLREELRKAERRNIELTEHLRQVTIGRQADRETRRAALNLMEDAVDARQAAQREASERRRAEEELREGNRRKDEFLDILAHELRTPLAPLRNGLCILRNHDDAATRHILEIMERQIGYIIRLVDDLMDVSRISQDKIELHRQRVALATLVKNAIDISQPALDAARHRLTVDIPNEPLMLDVDAARITQALANLLHNAAKYTNPGGQVCLRAARDGGQVQITVSDNGIGIAKEMLSKIFELFTRVDKDTARQPRGLGIGLTLVQTLVEKHGGAVEARSTGLGQGSEFIVTLPLAVDEPAPGP